MSDLKGLENGLRVIPGMGEVLDKVDRPGKAFSTENHARAEWSVFDAEAKGPTSSTEISDEPYSIGAMSKAELASASASAGPVKATVGIAVDTGASISPTQLEAKVLGTGISLGREVGISVLGTGFKIKLW